jgi:peptide chain release factor 1
VAIIQEGARDQSSPYDLRDPEHFDYTLFSGTGCGGQHRNKHAVSVRMTHLPTGLTQKAEGRVKQKNIEDAKARLIEALDAAKSSRDHSSTNATRSKQIGSGMRGDKIRTYRFQDDSVTDHRTGKTMTAKAFMKGDISRLW